MIRDGISATERGAAQSEPRVGLIEALAIAGREFRVIFGLPVLFGLLALAVSFLMTPLYTASTVLMPPQQQGSIASALADQLGALSGIVGGAVGLKSPSDLYVNLLKSVSVRNELIERFKLKERYGVRFVQDARKKLDSRIDISVDKLSGLISLQVTDEDAVFSAELANAHVEAVQHMMRRIASADAKQRRMFFQEQVDRISEMPFRNMDVRESIISAMVRQFEIAKIDEVRDGPLLQQVDVAMAPERRSRPKRLILTLLASTLGLLVGVILAAGRHNIQLVKANPAGALRWNRMQAAWSDAMTSVRRRIRTP